MEWFRGGIWGGYGDLEEDEQELKESQPAAVIWSILRWRPAAFMPTSIWRRTGLGYPQRD